MVLSAIVSGAEAVWGGFTDLWELGGQAADSPLLQGLVQAAPGLMDAFGADDEADLATSVAALAAKQHRRSARDAIARGRELERDYRTEISQLLGTQRAAFAANGVQVDVEGTTPAMLEASTVELAEIGVQRIRNSATREAGAHRQAARLERYRGALAAWQAGKEGDMGLREAAAGFGGVIDTFLEDNPHGGFLDFLGFGSS